MQGNLNKSRIMIVGGGGAALASIIEAAMYDVEIIVVSKHIYQAQNYTWSSKGGCTWKAHGFNAVCSENDSVQEHIADTLKGGAYANNELLAKILCEGASDLIPWLESMNVPFEKDEQNSFKLRPFGGCEVARSVYNKDNLGFYIHTALHNETQKLRRTRQLTILEKMRAIEIVKDEKSLGLKVVNTETLEQLLIECHAIILADGGGAQMYSPTAASSDKTCDGIAMAYRAGASVIDMEFVQFHPTGIVSDVPIFDGSLVEESLRFDGAKLLNKSGEQFMFNYNELGEKATRDEISRAIFLEMQKDTDLRTASVRLDIAKCKENLENDYPALHERLTQSGYDVSKENEICVRPTAHYMMGGVKIDDSCQTDIAGIFAAGETAGGIHGANRLGGNGLSEALVFGRIAGKNAAVCAMNSDNIIKKDFQKMRSFTLTSNPEGVSVDVLLYTLKTSMYVNAGPVRSKESLVKMLEIIDEIEEKTVNIRFFSGSQSIKSVSGLLDLKNLICASKLIVQSALLREESRGSHFRTDFTSTNKHYNSMVTRLEDNRMCSIREKKCG